MTMDGKHKKQVYIMMVIMYSVHLTSMQTPQA
jgi:hypothetical protein